MPYHNDEINNLMKGADEQLNKAISENSVDEWRAYKRVRNKLYKYIEFAKSIFYSEKLEKSSDMWKTIKNMTNTNKCSIPRRLKV